jgi:phosphocarrier protein FPr
VPVLVGLGVDELSVTPAAIPTVKDEVRKWSLTAARDLADEVVTLPSAHAVREAIARERSSRS